MPLMADSCGREFEVVSRVIFLIIKKKMMKAKLSGAREIDIWNGNTLLHAINQIFPSMQADKAKLPFTKHTKHTHTHTQNTQSTHIHTHTHTRTRRQKIK